MKWDHKIELIHGTNCQTGDGSRQGSAWALRVAPLPVAAAAGSDGPGSCAAARAALCLLPCCHRRYRYMRCVCVLPCGARFHLLVRPVCCVSCHVPRSHKRDGIMGLVYQKGWDYEKGPLLVPVTPFFFRSIVYELPPMRRGPHLCSL
jgi:hypothetical protein